MQLEIYNFRNWGYKKIEFGNFRTTLMSGKSGMGKSNIFEGLLYALHGGRSNVVKFGEKKCRVIFKFDGMKIERTNSPATVKVNDIYESDEAQNMIYKKFGRLFKDIGYMQQDSVNRRPFTQMNTTEKGAFLEKLVYGDIEISSFRKKIKEIEAERRKKSSEYEGALKNSVEILKKALQPLKLVVPNGCNEEDIAKIHREKVRYIKVLKNNIEENAVTIENLHGEYSERNNYESFVNIREEDLSDEKEKLEEVENFIKKTNISEVRKEKEEYKKKMVKIKKFNEYEKLLEDKKKDEKSYNELITKNSKERDEKIKKIKKGIMG